jgi:hypothetical protein
MNNISYKPGKDYTDYVLRRLDIPKQEEGLYRENGKWYMPKAHQIEYADYTEVGELFVEKLQNNFGPNVRLVEARALEHSASIQAVEPTPEYEVELKEIGNQEDLSETLKSHAESLPRPKDQSVEETSFGYLNPERAFQDVPESLVDDGDHGSVFYLAPRDEESYETLEEMFNNDGAEEVGGFGLDLQSRIFVRENGTINEVIT